MPSTPILSVNLLLIALGIKKACKAVDTFQTVFCSILFSIPKVLLSARPVRESSNN